MLLATSVSDAAVQLYRGDAAGALRAAESILASAPEDVDARLVATCAAVEAGDLARAGALVRSLDERRVPRAAVLRYLIERRTRSRSRSLMDDLALAWRDSGRLDLSGTNEALFAWRTSPLSLPRTVRLAAGARLLLSLPEGEEDQRRLAYAAAGDAKSNPLVVNLEILGLLGMQACPTDPAKQRTAVGAAVEEASRSDPGNGYVAVAGWIAGCPKKLDSAAVSLLTSAAARPLFRYPRKRAFQEILSIAEREHVPVARGLAVSAWLALDVPLMRLAVLAESVEEPSVRRAAGRALEAIGRRMAEGEAWLERLQGLSLAQKGATLSEDEEAIARTRALIEEQRRIYQGWAEAKKSMGLWPFAAEWREWTPDEAAASRHLLRVLSEYVR